MVFAMTKLLHLDYPYDRMRCICVSGFQQKQRIEEKNAIPGL